MATVTLRLSPRRAHVRTARLVAAAMARRSGVHEELLDEVRLAVGEACARAVQLHERHHVDAPIMLELIEGADFEVVVQDAVAQDLLPPPADTDWSEPVDTGVGLALLDALVDKIDIERPVREPGTRVHMKWPTTQIVA